MAKLIGVEYPLDTSDLGEARFFLFPLGAPMDEGLVGDEAAQQEELLATYATNYDTQGGQ